MQRPQPRHEAAQTGAEIIAAYVEATGGSARSRVNNRKMTGQVSFSGQDTAGEFITWQARPDKRRWVFTGESGHREQGCDGTVAWQMLGDMPRIKRGEELAVALRAAQFDGLASWRTSYKTAEYVGNETVEDVDCVVVILTPPVGQPERLFFSKKTRLLVKREVEVHTAEGTLAAQMVFADYRQVDGIMIPHVTRQTSDAREMVMTVHKIEHDITLSADQFDPPQPVQALLDAESVTSSTADAQP